ncbi:vitelline membrane outer layer protein 1 homolog [Anomaloglossus baeobatrachus]|uniref:vitelline membrane outer layer protein 1 homolog n=1 Tax=Anomaloglossus baeobatrachus TaxID=238106 RepID=UPI003F501D10
MLSKVLVLLLIVQTAQVLSNIISVSNGAQWGQWGEWVKCPNGSEARGFSLKVEDQHLKGDDTAVNGIRLHCTKCKPPHDEKTITSAVAPWGVWKPARYCNCGILSGFTLSVEPNQKEGDDTAVNNIKFQCTDKGQVEGRGLYWGEYGDWSETCAKGICGLRTKVQGNEKTPCDDNTGLNDVQFYCCN